MKNKYSVCIPQPCREDWKQMMPVDKGRFCQSCAKQVVDFSLMTDQEILNYISKAPGRLCGRFATDQLQRPLQSLKQEKKKTWWVAALMPLMMVFEKAGAQKESLTMGTPALVVKTSINKVTGKSISRVSKPHSSVGTQVIRTATEVTGIVMTEKGEVLPFASINVIGHPELAIADSTGHFTIKLYTPVDTFEVVASSIGYNDTRVFIKATEVNDITLILKEAEVKLPDMVVSSYARQSLVGFAGAFSVVRTISYTEKFDTLIRKVFHSETFKVFPNPAQRGQFITIDIKNAGEYSIQLFDNSGKLLLVKEFDAMEDTTQTSLSIPSTFIAGIYYIRLVDNKTKKQYTDKLAVM